MGAWESPRFTNDGEPLYRPSSYRKLLDRISFRCLLNITDGDLCPQGNEDLGSVQDFIFLSLKVIRQSRI